MRRAIATATMLLGACSALAASQPSDVLATALRGPRVPFSGTQVTRLYVDAGEVTSKVRVYADGRGGVRREFVTGAAAGVISLQRGRRAWQRPAGGAWSALPDGAAEGEGAPTAQAIAANYRVLVSPGITLLGRRATPVRIAPKRPGCPSRALWVEQATGIVLKDQLLGPDGRLRSTSEYTSLSVGPQAEALFAAPSRSGAPDLFGPSSFRSRPSASAVQQETGRPILLPAYVPPGFRIVLYGVMTTGSGRLMPVVRYSDGLAAITIFQRGWGAGRGAGRGQGRCVGQSDRQRAVIAVTATRSNYLLIGDISETLLRRVAESLP